jgi:hypothetical protein
MCVDEVLARDYLPFSIEGSARHPAFDCLTFSHTARTHARQSVELRVREKEEWEEVGREFAEETMQASALAVRGGHHNFDAPAPSPLVPPYTPTTGAEGAWHEFLLFEDDHSTCSSSSSFSSSSASSPPLSGFFPPSSDC